MAAVATRNPMRNSGGSDTGQHHQPMPPSLRSGALQSPSLFPFQQQQQQGNLNDQKSRQATPSRLTRANSDPPPDNLGRNNSHFELEPNPFEQSFSTSNVPKLSDTRSTPSQATNDAHPKPRRARSQSPARTPGIGGGNNTPSQAAAGAQASGSASRLPHQAYQSLQRGLPPLSALASPATEALQNNFWGVDNSSSLRSGPLSPAMLQGPAASTSHAQPPSTQAFDPNTFRTGLTPSITGQSMANPPGPATAALFDLMTNATPGGNPPNQFDLNFAKHMQQGRPSPRPITESESSSSFQSGSRHTAMSHNADQQDQSAAASRGVQPAQMSGQGPQQQQQQGSQSNNNGSSNGRGGNANNPLYLFSQATAEDFPGGNEEDLLAVNALRNLNSPAIPGMMSPNRSFAQAVEGLPVTAPPPNALQAGAEPGVSSGRPPSSRRSHTEPRLGGSPSGPAATAASRKRKAAGHTSDNGPGPASGRGAPRKRAAPKRTKTEDVDENMDDDMADNVSNGESMSLDDMPSVRPLTKDEKKRMTEEDKRKNFLERNRQAALKCRQRKKAWLTELQSKVDLLQSDNETLQATVQALKDEIHSLRSVLVAHKDCPIAVNNGLNGQAMSTISAVLNGQHSGDV